MTADGAAIEVWGGPECTVVRVGDQYSDQLERTGHDDRLDDLDRFASLGIRALRYPVVWEREPQWEWVDERLQRLRKVGVRPIVTLVHHGSGPRHTSLLDPSFPEKLASYARRVAERYPWVEDWTPVNEPLTTARFSCLHGFWYPHRRDALSLARALLNQVRAVVLSMRAIRAVVPNARLIQTDDLGKTHSTDALRYQAEHENERRWVTWDLLCGRGTAIHDWFRYVGIGELELRWFEKNPCPPDVVGINHYLSSERFLDHRLERYPERLHGSNGLDRYVDELAARILGPGPDGPAKLLLEAWERYRLPLAITEVQNACTREEQLRWLHEVWHAALAAREHGADVRAVTVWSLLGAAGWSSLLTGGDRYEPGAFDVRAREPRPTAVARMTRALARSGEWDHPVLHAPPWWRRPERLWYPAEGRVAVPRRPVAQPLLVTGGGGTLGGGIARRCELRGLPCVVLGRAQLDIADAAGVEAVLDGTNAWAVVNAAGYSRLDDAQSDDARCRRENSNGAAVLARACAQRRLPLVTFSCDQVFAGDTDVPYVESDAVGPVNVYGASKAEAERRVLEQHPDALVVRTSALFGPSADGSFADAVLRELAAGRTLAAAADVVVSPTYVPELVDAMLDLLIDGEGGLWHLANVGAVSWAAFARAVAAAAGLPDAGIEARPAAALPLVAPRPRYSALGSERGTLLEGLDAAVDRFVSERSATYGATFSHTASGGTRVADWTTEKKKRAPGASAAAGFHAPNSLSIQTQFE